MNAAGGDESGAITSGVDDGSESSPNAVVAAGATTVQPSAKDGGGSPANPRSWMRKFTAARERIRRRPGAYRAYRLFVGLIGFAIVAGGIALVPLPGPGWVIVFVGLHVLATEFASAAALERFARRQVAAWTAWLGRQALAVRVGLAALTVLAVALGVYALFVISGVPDWIPDSWVPDLPGLS